jgi:regulator of ribonuclease activity A
MSFSTADLYDAHEGKVQVATPMFRSFGARPKFYGSIVTVKCHEDNTSVREILNKENGK